MDLFLVQHGEARSEVEDPERSLTDRGEETVRKVAAWAARAGLRVGQIRHSGKRRAEQTAAILADSLRPIRGMVAVTGWPPTMMSSRWPRRSGPSQGQLCWWAISRSSADFSACWWPAMQRPKSSASSKAASCVCPVRRASGRSTGRCHRTGSREMI